MARRTNDKVPFFLGRWPARSAICLDVVFFFLGSQNCSWLEHMIHNIYIYIYYRVSLFVIGTLGDWMLSARTAILPAVDAGGHTCCSCSVP